MAKYYGLVPAAGAGARMGSHIPKQYLQIFNKPLLYHSLSVLCDYAAIERTYVVLAEGDRYWEHFDYQYFSSRLVPFFCGGLSRAESVLNGLKAMREDAVDDDWVMVHDAARPCLSRQHLDRLVAEIGDDPVGGLLAIPVADTLKRADAAGRVACTENREGLWQAQTPQMFRYGLLLEALGKVNGGAITDESQAVELLGYSPKLVLSDNRNIKVTYPQDLMVAKMVLTSELEMDS